MASRNPRKPVRSTPNPGARERGRYEIVPSETDTRRVAEPHPSYVAASATTVVSATEAARRFSDLVSRVCYQGETFVIERGGRPLCQLGPIEARRCTGADLLALLSRLPRPDEEFLAAVETASRTQPPVERSPWEK